MVAALIQVVLRPSLGPIDASTCHLGHIREERKLLLSDERESHAAAVDQQRKWSLIEEPEMLHKTILTRSTG